MSNYDEDWERLQGEVPVDACGQAVEEQPDLVFRTFQEACEWSKENAGRAFTRCANGEDFRPVRHSEAYQARQSWHEFEELYVEGPYLNEMS